MHVLSGPSRLVLVRHAESLGNVADRRANDLAADRLDLDVRDASMPLSSLGERQAEALGHHLRQVGELDRPTAILSSPYVRAVSTARNIAEAAGLPAEVETDDRLRERELGALDGMTGDGIRRTLPEEAARRRWVGKYYYRPPGGESWADVVLRIRQLLLSVSLTSDPPERLWVVSHQAVILAFRVALEGLSEEEVLAVDAATPVGNCALTSYSATGTGWQLGSFAVVPEAVGEIADETHEEPAMDRATEGAS